MATQSEQLDVTLLDNLRETSLNLLTNIMGSAHILQILFFGLVPSLQTKMLQLGVISQYML